RLSKFKADIQFLEDEIKKQKEAIKDSEKLIKKYQEQQMNVRNNREYDAITKELELQDLEIQVSKKKIGEAQITIENKDKDVEELKEILKDRKKDLAQKNNELETIISESESEENKLKSEREKASKKIDARIIKDRKSTRLNSSHVKITYADFCL